MAIIRPFKGIRPKKELAAEVASKPYDVLNSEEARVEVKGKKYSFLRVVKSEVDLPENIDVHSQQVYDKARENFEKLLSEGIMFEESKLVYYVYRQIMGKYKQTGIIACSSIEDYENDIIKKHEFTRPVKENDRINHILATGIHSGPVFLTYPDVSEIDAIVEGTVTQQETEYDFVADDGVQHTLWIINDETNVARITQLFAAKVPATYIADGHHRAASAYKVGKKRRDENPNHTGNEEYNFFLTVLFPASQLHIIDYNRLVKDLNGFSQDEFLLELSKRFNIENMNDVQVKPGKLHEFGMYINGSWYRLTSIPGTFDDSNPIGVLDVTVLQENVLSPVLNIKDPRTDERIDFVGGIRGLGELEKRVNSGEMAVAFSLFPVTIQQLIDIADSGNVMPPKSTWFEPKLRSGVVVHKIDG